MDEILSGKQFQRIDNPKEDLIIRQERRFCNKLLRMCRSGDITDTFYQKVRPVGSQPARLYGLAKIHKRQTPLRPILSMPGSLYEPLSKELAKWISKLPESNINCNVSQVRNALCDVKLEPDERVISLDVVSLFTNVPLLEAINHTAELLFDPD